MPEKDPSNYSLITYLWVLGLATLGGAVNFVRKVKEGTARAFNITEFIGELITSGFAGLLTFWLCEAADLNKLMSAVLIGISGHMGSRAIFRHLDGRMQRTRLPGACCGAGWAAPDANGRAVAVRTSGSAVVI